MKLISTVFLLGLLAMQFGCAGSEEAAPAPQPEAKVDALRFGTGCVCSPKGHVVTSLHVVEGMGRIDLVFADQSRAQASLVKADPKHDLAILQIEKGSAPKTWLGIAAGESLWMGQPVFSIGYPAVQVLGARPSLGEGVIARLEGTEDVPGSIMTTVPIQPGDSGGPLVDYEGRVVGVIAASADALAFVRSTGALPQNVNWAVKADWLRDMVTVPQAPPATASRRDAIEKAAAATCWIIATNR